MEVQRLLLGKPLNDSDYVFAHPDGIPLDPSTATHVFGRVTRRAGLGHLRLHDLRHTYTSIMIAAGVNVKAISQSLGQVNFIQQLRQPFAEHSSVLLNFAASNKNTEGKISKDSYTVTLPLKRGR